MSYTTSYTAFVALTLAFCVTAKAQRPAQQSAQQTPSAFTLTLALSQDIVDFTVDNLGNIYVLNSDNQLKKLGPRGDSLAVFNDVRRYGKIATIDAKGDHRMAMLGAVAGLASREGVEVVGMEAADVSYPGFVEDLTGLCS